MRLVLDIDGCLARFDLSYAALLVKHAGDKLPVGWRDDPELLTPVWDWDAHYGYTADEISEVWQNNILKVGSKFWLNLEPMEGVVEALGILNSLVKRRKIELMFLTDRMGDGAKYQTEEWLYKKCGVNYPTVILGANKAPLLALLKADFFLDDKPQTIEQVAKANIVGLKTYLKTAPYNKHCRLTGVHLAASLKDALIDFNVWEEVRRGRG